MMSYTRWVRLSERNLRFDSYQIPYRPRRATHCTDVYLVYVPHATDEEPIESAQHKTGRKA